MNVQRIKAIKEERGEMNFSDNVFSVFLADYL